MITQAKLKERLFYDAESGEFIWLVARRKDRLGKVAGANHSKGYRVICISGNYYFCHRLAWLYVHGKWPDGQIDHINANKSDNRISNLRDVSGSQNRQNIYAAMASNKSSGVLGVHWHKRGGKWRSSIRANGKQIHLGLFDSIEEAKGAYLKAKKEFHPFGEIAKCH